MLVKVALPPVIQARSDMVVLHVHVFGGMVLWNARPVQSNGGLYALRSFPILQHDSWRSKAIQCCSRTPKDT